MKKSREQTQTDSFYELLLIFVYDGYRKHEQREWEKKKGYREYNKNIRKEQNLKK